MGADGHLNPMWLLREDLVTQYCFPKGEANPCRRFVIEDATGNGLCCGQGHGYYELYWGTSKNAVNGNPYREKIRYSNFQNQRYEITRGCKGQTSNCSAKTKRGRDCIFPFVDDDGRMHHTCALAKQNKDVTYCATLVDPDTYQIRRWELCGAFNCVEDTGR